MVSSRIVKLAHGFTSLLTPDGYNPKTRKGRAAGYSTAIMHLAPAALSGLNVCRWSSPGCRVACLNTAGHGGILMPGQVSPVTDGGADVARYNAVQRARIARTRLFFQDRGRFFALLENEIMRHCRRARTAGMTPAVRLNGTSDLPWETVRLASGLNIFETFPDTQFYDYTKSVKRALRHAAGQMADNYHLTFSRSEANDDECRAVLAAGGNVAMVFYRELPGSWDGAPVLNGDADDLRFLDDERSSTGGAIVGLKSKGPGKRDTTGFVIRAS